ncbi:MAG: hypothetical protein LBE08_07010, partial [Bifidobacteriaceae bacterium]|nr:hypothetical protein [Bifidobacteriaceae bacterium]
MKRRLSIITVAALTAVTALGLTACANNDADYKIAITQYLAHPSLDAITQGFKDALAEKGVDAQYTYDDAQGDQANTATIA